MKVTHTFRVLLAATLACTLLLGSALAAPLAPQPATPDAAEAAQPVCVYGKVKEITPIKGGSQILLENSNTQDPYRQIILSVSDETMILNAVSGEKETMAALAQNETLYAYVGPAMTRSQPPIAHAALILCKIPADFAVPHWAEIKTVTKQENGQWDVLMTGDLLLHLNGETELRSASSQSAMTADKLQPGMRLLSWYSIVAPSMPAQASPDKVMVFAAAAAPELPITRSAFLEALYATVKNPAAAAAAPFADVTGSAAINWAYANKITTGATASSFSPEDILTRAELMVFLLRYASVLDKGPVGSWALRVSYADAKDIPAWAFSAAMWNEISKLVVPDSDNRILPGAAVTQAEANAALAGLLARK